MFARWFARGRIDISRPDGKLTVRVTGEPLKYAPRILLFVADEDMPSGTILFTRGRRWRFPASYSGGQEQLFRNFLGADVRVLPPGPQGGRRA